MVVRLLPSLRRTATLLISAVCFSNFSLLGQTVDIKLDRPLLPVVALLSSNRRHPPSRQSTWLNLYR